MAISCDIINSPRYQTLKNMSGVSEFNLNKAIETSLKNYGDYPQLDMIPYSNSLEYLEKQLNIKTIKDSKYVKTDVLLDHIQASSIEEANIKLNNLYRDLNIDLYPISDTTSVISIENRPTECSVKSQQELELDDDILPQANNLIIERQLDLMQQRFGIQIIPITNTELESDDWRGLVPESRYSNAFVYNGNIYINTDNANIKESKIHELMHIFLGAIRFTNPNLYFSLVQSVEQLPYYEEEASLFINRTQNDIDEEIFVKEFSKYLTGSYSMFEKLDSKILNNIMYEVKRNIDNFIDGKYSVRICDFKDTINYSITDLIKILNSPLGKIDYPAILDQAKAHRILANTKENLMKKQELIQECF